MKRVVFMSVLTFAFVACGGGGDGGTDPNNQQPEQVTQTIGPAGGTVVTPTGAAGVQIPAGTFTQPVSVSVSRIEVTTQPGSGPLATSLKQYGPFYEFSTSPQIQTFGDSVRVGVCQVTDPSSPNYAPEPHASLRLAHTVGNSVEILEPVDVSSFLRCTNVSDGGSTHTSLFARALGKIFRAPMLYAAHGGLGGKTKSFSPFGAVQIAAGPEQFSTVSAGDSFSCAITTSGKAYCWGRLPQGGSTLTPLAVSTLQTFTSINASGGHACALNSLNSLWCWGQNNFGQVGNRTTNTPVYPPEGVFGSISGPTGLGDHTCALDFDTHRAFCWGHNGVGQLGIGTADENAHTQPEPVSISNASPTTWSKLSVGPRHTCGSSGTFLFCWGDNGDGKLGDGTNTNRFVPTKVVSNVDFTTVSAGVLHTCALAASGAAYCWGQNFYGQLGGGTQPNNPQANEFVPVAVTGGLTFRQITTGFDFTCGITTPDALAYCWGRNNFGQLGDVTNTDRRVPTLVGGGIQWESISAGATHACGRSKGGLVFCWGDNSLGQLGNGTTQNANIPIRVSGQP